MKISSKKILIPASVIILAAVAFILFLYFCCIPYYKTLSWEAQGSG